MKQIKLTDSKLLLLGPIAEMPRHAYELEKLGLVKGQKAIGPKGKKIFGLTKKGQKELPS